jgi:hypothetical protein
MNEMPPTSRVSFEDWKISHTPFGGLYREEVLEKTPRLTFMVVDKWGTIIVEHVV